MNTRLRVILSSLTVTTFMTASRADYDVRPYVSGGKLITGGYDDGTSSFVPVNRVFEYAFQEDLADPYFTSDPGFNSTSSSGIPGGSQISFNILGGSPFGLPANLTYWDGNDTDPSIPGVQVGFGLVPDNESITFSYGSNSITVSNTAGGLNQPGFVLQTVTSSGAMHRHLGAQLNGGSGLPTDGIYLLAMEIVSSSPGVTKSDPFFLLYNNGLSDQQLEIAYDYVTEQVVVPEVSSMLLAAFGTTAVAGIWIRKHRRKTC